MRLSLKTNSANPDPAPSPQDDQRWMRAALALARRGEGRTCPNPAVGCVIVRNGCLMGRGWTRPGGRPHAETVALNDAGGTAAGATAYVTLEPCSHHGKTPPCADALISAGISRVVVAITDPDDRVSGQGIERLKAAGITVTTGVLGDEVASFYAAYIRHRLTGLPLVTIKLATSLDGRIALADGTSQWITSAVSRARVHLMRSRTDAIMTSAATVLADNPTLNCRLPGVEGCQPLRVVVSTGLALDPSGNLRQSLDQGPVLHLHSDDLAPTDGIEQIRVAAAGNGKPDLSAVMRALGESGITSVMVEAGGRFAASLIREGLVQRLVWMRSAMLIGHDGLPAIADLGLEKLAEGHDFKRVALYPSGPDTVEVLERL